MRVSESTEEFIENFKLNVSLCCIMFYPIMKEILIFHHFTEIYGSIANPLKKWVALKGSVPSALDI